MLADLPDHARVLLVPCVPPLTGAEATALVEQLDKLFAQFAREGRVGAWAAGPELAGAVLVIAWDGDAELSGCSRDRIGRLLLTHEARAGRLLVSAPPIVVATAEGVRCVDRPQVKALIAAGVIDADAEVYDLRSETIGGWRASPSRRLGDGPWAGLLPTRA